MLNNHPGKCHPALVARLGMLVFVFFADNLFAETPASSIIQITQDTLYHHATLNLGERAFVISRGATLTLEDCDVFVAVSPRSPVAFSLAAGRLIMKNNTLHVKAVDIQPAQAGPVKFSLVKIMGGSVLLANNRAAVDRLWSVGFLMAGPSPTEGHVIVHNHLRHFQGGIFLTRADRVEVAGNHFDHVSGGNIFVLGGSHIRIRDNQILFPGNGVPGDGIDVLDADHIQILHNYIGSGYCYSIYLSGIKNVTVSGNYVTSGITYALYVDAGLHSAGFAGLTRQSKDRHNQNLTVAHNYFAQNRYGLAATDVAGLSVRDNIFVQRFLDNAARQFWTDNRILLKAVSGLDWQRNDYREAFPQEGSDNCHARQRVPFPVRGGVVF